MAIYQLEDDVPEIHASAWVADSAQVMGRVILAENASVWSGAVLRGDNETISIGCDSNVQDGSVLHTDAGQPLVIGDGVTIGHQVMLHGCTVGDGSLIGIRSVIMNHAVIGKRSLVGAGTLIPEGKTYPDGVLILGTPGRVVRDLTADEIAHLEVNAQHYVENAIRYRAGFALQDPPR